MAWDPQLYLRYGGHRLRPATDLLAQVSIEPATVVDLGSGTGVVSAIMSERWPDATIVGVDNSTEMLDVARRDHPTIGFVEADAAEWRAEPTVDLVYSNAALHWLDDHESLFPRLLDQVSPGGQLAVQMPLNHQERAWTLVDDVARRDRWASRLVPLLRPAPVSEPAAYHHLLDPFCSDLTVWETTYLQKVTGDEPVANWVRGSFLRPLLGALAADERDDFFDDYAREVARHYPLAADGSAMLPFRRVFMVATR